MVVNGGLLCHMACLSLQRREILGREASKLALSDDQRRKLEEEM